jgi:transmembrane sensor
MTQKTDNQIMFDTDKAWDKLYSRLERDGLVAEQSTHRKLHLTPIFPVWMKWAASFLILITTGLILFSILTQNNGFQTITNSENNTMIQVLHDGSIVYLAENSTLSYPIRFNKKQRTVYLQGQAFFDIEHNPDNPFCVETEIMNVKVLGTSFNIKTDGAGLFEILVEEGLVEVQKRETNGQRMEVGRGELLRVADNTFYKTISQDMTASSWRTTRMQFKDETLENVLAVISRNYNTKLYIEQSSLKNRRLTVTFYNNTLPTIIELICVSMGLEVEEHPDTGILFKPKT